MQPSPSNMPTAQQALFLSRIMWGAMCMGVILIAGVMLGMLESPRQTPDREQTLLFTGIAAAITLPAIGIGLFVRSQIFKQGWVGDAVKPSSYVSGTLVALASCEGACFAGIVFAFVTGGVMPLIPAAVAFAVLVLLFPNGKAMQPHAHRYR